MHPHDTLHIRMKQLIKIHTDSSNQINLQGIDLSSSFILNWNKNDSEFEIELELSIWPESPYYRKPLKGEYTCYKRGKLRFLEIKEIHGFVELDLIKPNIDPDGSKDWESIYDFRKENNQFKLKTDFTELAINCSGFEIEIIK